MHYCILLFLISCFLKLWYMEMEENFCFTSVSTTPIALVIILIV